MTLRVPSNFKVLYQKTFCVCAYVGFCQVENPQPCVHISAKNTDPDPKGLRKVLSVLLFCFKGSY